MFNPERGPAIETKLKPEEVLSKLEELDIEWLVKHKDSIPDGIGENPAIKDNLAQLIRYGDNYWGVEPAINALRLSDEILLSPEIQIPAENLLLYRIKHPWTCDPKQAIEVFKIPRERAQRIVEESLHDIVLEERGASKVEALAKEFNIPDKLVHEVFEGGFKLCVRNDLMPKAIRIIETGRISEDLLMSQWVREKMKENLEARIGDGSLGQVKKIIKAFKLSEEETKVAAKGGLAMSIGRFSLDRAKEIIDKFKLAEDDVQSSAKEGLVEAVQSHSIFRSKAIIETFKLPADVLSSPDVQKMAAQDVQTVISNGDLAAAKDIIKTFKLSDQIVSDSVKDGLGRISSQYITRVPAIIEEFKISEELAKEAGRRLFQNNFMYEWAKNIKLSLIKDVFKLNVGDMMDVSEKARNRMEAVKQISPELYDRCMKSEDRLVVALEFFNAENRKLLESNPFLLEAAVRNPRYGFDLAVVYEKLDKDSVRNIKNIFKFFDKIRKDDPEIDPDSAGFRVLMQKYLLKYKNNPQIAKDISSAGIDLKQWLEHEEVINFKLGKTEEYSFVKAASIPLLRLKDSLDAYQKSFLSVLKEFEKDFRKIDVTDKSALEEELEDLEKARKEAIEAGEDKKAAGIAASITAKQKKLDGLKKISLWDIFIKESKKLDGQKSAIGALVSNKDLKKGHVMEQLPKTSTAISDFKQNIIEASKGKLSDSRINALIQEAEESVKEEISHFEADIEQLGGFILEKDENKFLGEPFAIKLWSRNPHVDLYQGDYSVCCVSINNNVHGSESPISDYITDVGIQVLNIVDKSKNIPIAAAWLWLGRNDEGKTALVVDNIEANTDYTKQNREELEEKLKKYLVQYAKDIKVDLLVMGAVNNDLYLEAESSIESSFKKIGEPNRADGYYLEAEDAEVDLIWSKEN